MLPHPLEHLVKSRAEHVGDAEGGFEGGRVLARLDGGDRLAGHADLLRQFGLRHLFVLEAQPANLIGDGKPMGLRHASGPPAEHDDLRHRDGQDREHHVQQGEVHDVDDGVPQVPGDEEAEDQQDQHRIAEAL